MIGSSAATVGIATNMAGSNGGAIYSQSGLVTISGKGITVEGNGATTGKGGAVYAGNGFTLNASGPATISSNAGGALGGAIYLNGGNLALNATGGWNIAFSGNDENAAPNAIYFNNAGSASQATFNTAAGQTISFFDPIESNGANGTVPVIKIGPGTVSFDGALKLS
jgi:predicted outer membrane repeat protein